mmetsp:Transcript_26753/g.46115  ORF Transcript_26753/g.46115 Transcript_26753/m.46115 type:complete len:96 (-) Transcript_26753:517-804(-)
MRFYGKQLGKFRFYRNEFGFYNSSKKTRERGLESCKPYGAPLLAPVLAVRVFVRIQSSSGICCHKKRTPNKTTRNLSDPELSLRRSDSSSSEPGG